MPAGGIDIVLMLHNILEKIGFKTVIDRNPVDFGLDLIANKFYNNNNYRICFEIKSNVKNFDAVRYGVETLKKSLKNNSYDKLVLILNSNESFKNLLEFRNLSKDFPISFEIINPYQISQWSSNLFQQLKVESESKVIVLFKNVYQQIIKEIVTNPFEINFLDWRQLENLVAEIFTGLGFMVTLTPPSKDGGKDVILECYESSVKKSYIIEIKHWKSGKKVGHKSVSEFLRVIVNEKRDKGMFLSSSGYSSNYLEFVAEIEKPLISFGDTSKIVSLCSAYEKINNGLLLPVENLNSFLSDDTIKFD